MINSFILTSSVVIGVFVTLAYINKSSAKQPVANNSGQYLLRMHKIYYYTGLLSLALADVFSISLLLIENLDLLMLFMSLAMILLFGGLGVLSIDNYKKHYLLYDNDIIEVSSRKGVIKIARWKDLQQSSFNSISGFMQLKTIQGEKLKIHQHLVGFTDFVNFMNFKTR